MTVNVGTPEALRSWVEHFEEHITEPGGPIRMVATFEHELGEWSLICSRDDGTQVIAPSGETVDVDTLLREATA